MSLDVLVLNADCQPLNLVQLSAISWQEAVSAIWMDKASIVEEYDDWEVHSAYLSFKVPSVIMLKEYVNHNNFKDNVKFNKHNVFLRDEFKCQYCGIDFHNEPSKLTYDHVVPKYHGGKTTWANVTTACFHCNSCKGHSVNMKPLKAPTKPSYYDLVNKRKKFPIVVPHKSWIPYIGWSEDLIKGKN